MYRPCLHCGGHYDENECAQICTYGEERKRLRERLAPRGLNSAFPKEKMMSKKMFSCRCFELVG